MTKNFSKTANDVWETPIQIFEFAKAYFQVFPKLDVASTHENSLCEFHFTEREDGLKQTWFKDVWMNPPYSKASKWIQKASEENKKNNINIIALLNVTTDTRAWHNFVLSNKTEICFLEGRVRFNQHGIRAKHPSQHPSCLVCWRKRY